MCGRYAVTTDPAKLAAEIEAVNEVPDLPSDGSEPVAATKTAPGVNYNVAPTTMVMTVVKRHDHENPDDDPQLRVRAMRWGLVPSWSKEPGKGPLLFNARAETAAQKSSFRSSVRSYRCLVPMDGWYEWKNGPLDSKGKPTKIPFFMSPHDGTRLFMAGLWSVWHPKDDADAPALLSCSILTTDAVGKLQDVHDRMPLILSPAAWPAWLEAAAVDITALPMIDAAAMTAVRLVWPVPQLA